jgi:hypothetical protein
MRLGEIFSSIYGFSFSSCFWLFQGGELVFTGIYRYDPENYGGETFLFELILLTLC